MDFQKNCFVIKIHGIERIKQVFRTEGFPKREFAELQDDGIQRIERMYAEIDKRAFE